jgi:hypothetical protein
MGNTNDNKSTNNVDFDHNAAEQKYTGAGVDFAIDHWGPAIAAWREANKKDDKLATLKLYADTFGVERPASVGEALGLYLMDKLSPTNRKLPVAVAVAFGRAALKNAEVKNVKRRVSKVTITVG